MNIGGLSLRVIFWLFPNSLLFIKIRIDLCDSFQEKKFAPERIVYSSTHKEFTPKKKIYPSTRHHLLRDFYVSPFLFYVKGPFFLIHCPYEHSLFLIKQTNLIKINHYLKFLCLNNLLSIEIYLCFLPFYCKTFLSHSLSFPISFIFLKYPQLIQPSINKILLQDHLFISQ